MTQLTPLHEIAQLAEGLPSCMFADLFRTETKTAAIEPWAALLHEFTPALEPKRPVENEVAMETVASDEVSGPLQKLAAGPNRSLGGYFDYTHWKDRERFLELDRLIASGQTSHESEDAADHQMF